ncbi:hypothetical protein PCANC_10330 [Puccinia coronata f. sp. avenae]|uniref:Uncharacterized protein n=1 Tax=Puccinia coronata f. sp. avenae TaxID=200324 RepID=A0A2N5SXH1_9BASI|nr:hypothetical protein PCANC_10330 [Puccinia coronata f. sp. avenae]PLW22942.1 hypothetical protein PCASD_12526 [Puccinia coronata f. sp. avenae]PLW48075.1 hypothetical protein PCASD_03549 [Puccinia coronata f. sp. avenae]
MISAGSPLLRARGPTQAQPKDCFPGCGLVRALAQFDLARPSPPFHAGRVRTANLVLSPAHFQPDVRAWEQVVPASWHDGCWEIIILRLQAAFLTTNLLTTTAVRPHLMLSPPQLIKRSTSAPLPMIKQLPKPALAVTPPKPSVTAPKAPGPAPGACIVTAPKAPGPAPKAPGPARGASVVTAPEAPGPAPVAERDQREPSHKKS